MHAALAGRCKRSSSRHFIIDDHFLGRPIAGIRHPDRVLDESISVLPLPVYRLGNLKDRLAHGCWSGRLGREPSGRRGSCWIHILTRLACSSLKRQLLRLARGEVAHVSLNCFLAVRRCQSSRKDILHLHITGNSIARVADDQLVRNRVTDAYLSRPCLGKQQRGLDNLDV